MEKQDNMLAYIIRCIEETGNDPRAQIKGYLSSCDERYITRNGDARRLIKSIDNLALEQYVAEKHVHV